MSDLISREDALNCFPLMMQGELFTVETIRHQLKKLPSVELQEWISPTAEPVSAEEAKKLLYQEFKGKMKDGNPRLLVAYEIAMKALEAQTEWISVKDRKPTMSDNFYVTIQYPLHRGVEKVFYSVQQNKWYSVDADRIIAWREVEPSPYKGEEE